MKKTMKLAAAIMGFAVFNSFGQWSNSGDNYTSGSIYITNQYSRLFLNNNNNNFIMGNDGNNSRLFLSSSTAIRLSNSGYNSPGTGLYVQNNNVGIGTPLPLAKLDVNGNVNAGGTENGWWQGFRSNAPSGKFGFNQSDIFAAGIAGNIYNKGFSLNALGIMNGSTTAQDIFLYNRNDANAGYLVLRADGGVGIGTVATTGFKLSVEGLIRARELQINSDVWSDYVFKSDYKLASLEEVEAQIKKDGHLKDVPSAEEVAKTGYKVGEMDATLLRKIEELTLYVIDLKRELNTLKTK